MLPDYIPTYLLHLFSKSQVGCGQQVFKIIFACVLILTHTFRRRERTSVSQMINSLYARLQSPPNPLLKQGQPRFKIALLCLGLFCLRHAQPVGAATYEPSKLSPPKPIREFRGAWVATVGNIDWPSRKSLSTAEQKAELLGILDRAAKIKLNAVIFQVRPMCDAMYASTLEPWSEFLTGAIGKPPEPYYDPLAFAVTEAHKRGLELHAWFNPYRAGFTSGRSAAPATHISKTRPELVREYGKYLWLDPGEHAVQEHSLNVVMDVVKRYDVDGVHFDDYFYPYKESAGGKELDFPDEASWKKHGANGKLSRDDWRRENVNVFIQNIYKSVKATKPWVKFGVSPFGIWRPGYPEQIKGFDAYGQLYADSRKWLVNGWVDYFVPQLYWAIEPKEQSFPVLLNWWNAQNPKHRHIWPGMDTTKVRDRSGDGEYVSRVRTNSTRPRTSWKADEIVAQIRLTANQPSSAGHVHWNMKSLLRSSELQTALDGGPYMDPALVPASPWIQKNNPPPPQFSAVAGGASVKLAWENRGATDTASWLLQYRRGNKWITQILPKNCLAQILDGAPPDLIALSVVNRVGNASAATVLKLSP